MAISAVMFFRSDENVRKIYDAVIDDMRVRDRAPEGAIYHWCAPVSNGLEVCEVWESREYFERFADERTYPLTAKHGLHAPQIEITPVHERIEGRAMSHKGVALFLDFQGDTQELLHALDQANARMNVRADPPDGLIMHWTVPARTGIRIVDHWRSRDDFDQFVETRLADTLADLAAPTPRITQFDVYNTIDRRIVVAV